MDELSSPPRRQSQDQRAELMLGALVCGVVVLLVAMLVFVVHTAWPSFSHNGLSWFGSGGGPDREITRIFNSGEVSEKPDYFFRAWPLIWSTLLITTFAMVIAFFCSLFVAVFIVGFAPEPMKRILEPVVRLLASVPSVIYGLLGVVILVPFIGNHLITQSEKQSVNPTIQLSGQGVLAAVLVLALMVSPIMIAIFSGGLRAVPGNWLEGSLALGINPWRGFWKIAVRTARPTIVAGTVLALARALGETIMLSMLSGSVAFPPNPIDGWIFFFEPSRGLASTILAYNEELTSPPLKSTLFAIGAVLLFSTMLLSLGGWAVKQPMKRYGVVA